MSDLGRAGLVSADDGAGDIAGRLRASGSVFAEEEARLLTSSASTPDQLEAMVVRRTNGEPLEHVVGWAEFCGHRILVDSGVFVPRRRTELLVREAVAMARPGAVIVEMCCGAGAVATVLAELVNDAEVHAADIDPVGVGCARRNVVPAGGQVYEGDLYEALPGQLRGTVDVLVANAPYVPSGEIGLMPRDARLFEPLIALDGGLDGLDLHRRIAAEAPAWLAPDGHLLIEVSDRQVAEATEVFRRSGLTPSVVNSEDFGTTIVVGAKSP